MKYIAFMLFSLLLFSCSENGKFIEIKNEAKFLSLLKNKPQHVKM